MLGEVYGCLSGRVSGADDEHVLVVHSAAFAHCGAVKDAGAYERLQFGHSEPPPFDSGRDHDCTCVHLGPVQQSDNSVIAVAFERDRLLCKHDVGSHQPGLLASSLHQGPPAMPCGNPG